LADWVFALKRADGFQRGYANNMNALVKWTMLAVPTAAALVFAGCALTRAGYKSPDYKLRERLDRVEVREYPALVLAQTPTKKEVEGRDGSFMRLFRFITKGNASAQPIPMTTPVLYRGEGSAEAMAFVLPATMKTGEVPAPLDAAVSIQTRPPGTFATLRMRGGRKGKSREKALAQIKSVVERSDWLLEGAPEFAFYDPPWIPWFLEKNEVLFRVVKKSPPP
jgi:hypothetical protein